MYVCMYVMQCSPSFIKPSHFISPTTSITTLNILFRNKTEVKQKSEKDTANFEFLSLLYGVLSLLDSKQSLNFLCNKETKNGNVLR